MGSEAIVVDNCYEESEASGGTYASVGWSCPLCGARTLPQVCRLASGPRIVVCPYCHVGLVGEGLFPQANLFERALAGLMSGGMGVPDL